jgi:hypothetical protein
MMRSVVALLLLGHTAARLHHQSQYMPIETSMPALTYYHTMRATDQQLQHMLVNLQAQHEAPCGWPDAARRCTLVVLHTQVAGSALHCHARAQLHPATQNHQFVHAIESALGIEPYPRQHQS